MPGVLALLLVIVVVFLIFFSENLQKKKMEEQLNTIIGNQKVLYGSMANLTVGTGFVRGYFAITERYLYFIESKKDGTIKLTIQLKFEEILSHKLHILINSVLKLCILHIYKLRKYHLHLTAAI